MRRMAGNEGAVGSVDGEHSTVAVWLSKPSTVASDHTGPSLLGWRGEDVDVERSAFAVVLSIKTKLCYFAK